MEHKEIANNLNKKVLFWAFIRKINNQEIKVVIRKVGNGKPHFFSVYSRDKK